PGIKLELEVLLSLGRADEVRASLSDETMVASKHILPYYDIPAPRMPDGTSLYSMPYSLPSYEWLLALAAAATGDYEQARFRMRELRQGLQAGSERLEQQRQVLERGNPELVVGLFSAPAPLQPLFSAKALGMSRKQIAALAASTRSLTAQQADLCVLE